MGINFLILLLIVGLVVLLGWLTRRAWRTRNPFLKWIGATLSSLLMLVALFIGALGLKGMIQYYNPPANPVRDIQVEGTPEQIARGQHLAAAFCVECHSTTADFPMTGGLDLGRDVGGTLGSFTSVNLTPAGPLKDWSDGEIFRALRDNVDKDGNRLVFMTATNVRYIADEDMLALIAFLRSQEPVEKETPLPPDQPSFLGLMMMGANIIPNRPLVTEPIVAPEKEATPEYGHFMISFLDCTGCHGDDLNGGTSSIGPKGPSLRLVKNWTEEEFITTLRTGIDPSGREINATIMPWRSTGRLDDVELSALYQYLVSLQ
ncbi:MAG TPA: c-type cytochrome [Anaerolineales bacterium]|nr:c-type cytochrome [Anaerolineales bacterium]